LADPQPARQALAEFNALLSSVSALEALRAGLAAAARVEIATMRRHPQPCPVLTGMRFRPVGMGPRRGATATPTTQHFVNL